MIGGMAADALATMLAELKSPGPQLDTALGSNTPLVDQYLAAIGELSQVASTRADASLAEERPSDEEANGACSSASANLQALAGQRPLAPRSCHARSPQYVSQGQLLK